MRGVFKPCLYDAHTVLRPPAEHARLLRGLVAVCVARSGQCTAVWGHPQRRVRAGWRCRVLTRVLTRYSQGTHTVPLCTAAWSWADVTQCSACVRHHGVYSKVGERHRTEGDLACDARRVLDGYSTAEYRAHRSAPVRQHCGCVLSAYAMHCDLSRAQRRRAFRHPRRPTSATPTRRRARRRSRRRAGRTSPTRRVRAMRSTRLAFPHSLHSLLFSCRHLSAARCIA